MTEEKTYFVFRQVCNHCGFSFYITTPHKIADFHGCPKCEEGEIQYSEDDAFVLREEPDTDQRFVEFPVSAAFYQFLEDLAQMACLPLDQWLKAYVIELLEGSIDNLKSSIIGGIIFERYYQIKAQTKS